MGKNNKAHRAAKAKRRAKRGSHRGPGVGRSGFGQQWDELAADPSFQIAAAWVDLQLETRHEGGRVQLLADRVARFPTALADREAENILAGMVAELWQGGWQPAELRRHIRRKCSAAAARLVEVVILADHDGRRGQGVDERWAVQLRELSQREVSTRGGWLANWSAAEGMTRAESYVVAATVMATICEMPALDVLIPPPGAPAGSASSGLPASDWTTGNPMLARVRKLLAKAESTEFEEEATSLTSKAQELMTRHAIDVAMLHRPDEQDVPRMIRLPVDAPYVDAKSVLLGVVATANRCRSVLIGKLELCVVVGHAADLNAVEILFTSLLVQAQNALTEAGRAGGFGRRARSQLFRSSFFLAYAQRIGERLRVVNDEVLAKAEQPQASLPVLRDREHAVEEFMNQRYGDSLTMSPVRGGYDNAGSAYGRQAADAAKLDSGELLW